jgi:hypothetical protein
LDCFLSMGFGAVLAGVGIVMFGLKQRRINKYFKPDDVASSRRNPHLALTPSPALPPD